ncbi:trypco2 family protein [Streptomyces sp. 4N509B]|uniref:trypco2 family protein n=1 Tax=Streptomyces sp. 4N509B TaxID=3457413 RepID=UPI003FD3321F
MEGDHFVGLAEAIRQVRQELVEAQEDGVGQPMRFVVQQVSLEFAVQVHRSGDGRTGLRIGVLTADLGGGASRDTTHRIQVDLQPVDEDGHVSRVGRR